jgi:hypothetical protein
MDMEDGRIDRGVFKRWGEVVVGGASGTNTGSAYTIDLTGGNVFNLILNANCAFTFSNPTGSGAVCSFTLILHQDATGGRTATWPSAVVWPFAPDPSSLAASANAINVFSFVTYDGGLNWLGFIAGQIMPPLPPWPDRYGYFAGGAFPLTATVDRIDYANDTATAAVKGPLSSARYVPGATGNSSFSYFGGGNSPNFSLVDRIDYSNDTATAAVKGPLSLARFQLAATGNSSFGYFGGGRLPSAVSTVDRIDYSNDTATAAVKGPLSLARYGLAAIGTSSFGYFGGGVPTTSTVDRIDYSNDTATAAVKGPLSAARYYSAAIGTSSFGYFSGGVYGPTIISTVDRIDYSNDTATAAVKGPLSLARYGPGATSHAAGL